MAFVYNSIPSFCETVEYVDGKNYVWLKYILNMFTILLCIENNVFKSLMYWDFDELYKIRI